MEQIGKSLIRAIKLLEEGFVALPKWVARDRKLSAGAKLVFSVLWTRKNADFMAWPGQQYIGNMLGLSERQVRRYLVELEEAKYLVKKRRGCKKTNMYELSSVVDKVLANRGQTQNVE